MNMRAYTPDLATSLRKNYGYGEGRAQIPDVPVLYRKYTLAIYNTGLRRITTTLKRSFLKKRPRPSLHP